MSKEAGCGCDQIDQRLLMLEQGAATRGSVEGLRFRVNKLEKNAEIRNAVLSVLYLLFVVGWLLHSNGWVTFQRPMRDE